MSDLILDAIKQFLYERQLGQEGKLDGTLYFCKGFIPTDSTIHPASLPLYMIIERYQGFNNQIYYKCTVNSHVSEDGREEYEVIRNKNNTTLHFFTKPMGSILLITTIIQRMARHMDFTFITTGNAIQGYFSHLTLQPGSNLFEIQTFVQNVLTQFEYVDFKHHQYFNKVVA